LTCTSAGGICFGGLGPKGEWKKTLSWRLEKSGRGAYHLRAWRSARTRQGCSMILTRRGKKKRRIVKDSSGSWGKGFRNIQELPPPEKKKGKGITKVPERPATSNGKRGLERVVSREAYVAPCWLARGEKKEKRGRREWATVWRDLHLSGHRGLTQKRKRTTISSLLRRGEGGEREGGGRSSFIQQEKGKEGHRKPAPIGGVEEDVFFPREKKERKKGAPSDRLGKESSTHPT